MEHLRWEAFHGGQYPPNAVRASEHVFVIRAQHDGHWTPGKGVHGHGDAYVPFGGKEQHKKDYEVLTLHGHRSPDEVYKWKKEFKGEIADRSVIAGHDVDGEPLYVARSVINGEVCCGKVKPSHRCAYMPWGGKEHRVDNYEVLIVRK